MELLDVVEFVEQLDILEVLDLLYDVDERIQENWVFEPGQPGNRVIAV